MQKFHCLLFVSKRSYIICYYVICMTVPLNGLLFEYLIAAKRGKFPHIISL